MTAMRVELAFTDDAQILCRGELLIASQETVSEFHSRQGEIFRITHQYQEPACPVSIRGFRNGKALFRREMQIAVHNSDDWEAIDLPDPFGFCFRCTVISSDSTAEGDLQAADNS